MENCKKFYINGAWVDPASSETLAVINPATEKPVATIALGTAEDVDRAVAAARAAFDSYS
ncbi:aldehyde dehydrogenase, partial [Rhodococcus opacus M213]